MSKYNFEEKDVFMGLCMTPGFLCPNVQHITCMNYDKCDHIGLTLSVNAPNQIQHDMILKRYFDGIELNSCKFDTLKEILHSCTAYLPFIKIYRLINNSTEFEYIDDLQNIYQDYLAYIDQQTKLLEEKCDMLQKQNEILENMIYYHPNKEGAENCKIHFNSLRNSNSSKY